MGHSIYIYIHRGDYIWTWPTTAVRGRLLTNGRWKEIKKDGKKWRKGKKKLKIKATLYSSNPITCLYTVVKHSGPSRKQKYLPVHRYRHRHRHTHTHTHHTRNNWRRYLICITECVCVQVWDRIQIYAVMSMDVFSNGIGRRALIFQYIIIILYRRLKLRYRTRNF